ncbi:MAG TPA: NHL repeat-containing protein [Solirubrobacterales bacterium]|nr:NHL repeat-containing protein [Solirubrobacterales bacterium]
MVRRRVKGIAGVALVVVCLAAAIAAPMAHAAAPEPDFVYRPFPPPPPKPVVPPPWGYFEGPCGVAVDPAANFYISDYYHDSSIDAFDSAHKYLNTQLTGTDPLDGPCGLALGSSGALYVNDYHRSVQRYQLTPFPPTEATPASFGPPTTIDSEHPTGVAVDPVTQNAYVDQRTQVAVYGPSGSPLEASGEPLLIGQGSLGDGYGIAVSGYPATQGYLYVPDASDDTVKVYDPATETEEPVAVIDGHETPTEGFVSLRDSAIAVDNTSGEIYVADNLQPQYTEYPEAVIYVFDATGAYEGRLKYPIVDALPPGLAVDNSAEDTQGRVYVTSGNTDFAAVYAYPPGSATTTAGLCPPHAVDCTGAAVSSSSASPQAQVPVPQVAGTAALGFAAPATTTAQKAKPRQAKHRHRHHRHKTKRRGR